MDASKLEVANERRQRRAPSSAGASLERDRLITRRQLQALVPLGKEKVRQLELAGEFPRRVRIGAKCYWSEREVLNWIRERLDDSRVAPDRERRPPP